MCWSFQSETVLKMNATYKVLLFAVIVALHHFFFRLFWSTRKIVCYYVSTWKMSLDWESECHLESGFCLNEKDTRFMDSDLYKPAGPNFGKYLQPEWIHADLCSHIMFMSGALNNMSELEVAIEHMSDRRGNMRISTINASLVSTLPSFLIFYQAMWYLNSCLSDKSAPVWRFFSQLGVSFSTFLFWQDLV